jgi:hypothetical protein
MFTARSATFLGVLTNAVNLQRLAQPETFVRDLIAAREGYLKLFITREQLRERATGGWDADEKLAFELGEEIDQGIRPRNVYLRAECRGEVPESAGPPPIWSRYLRPGELEPDQSWLGSLGARWLLFLATPLDLDRLERDCACFSDEEQRRRERVSLLRKHAAEAICSTRGLPSLDGHQAFPVAPSTNLESARRRLPLGIDPAKREIRVKGTDRVAEFGDNELPFNLTVLVHNHTHRHDTPFKYANLHFELWGTLDESEEARDRIRQHVLTANEKMCGTIRFELRARRNIGYVLVDLDDPSVKQRRTRKRKRRRK